MAPYKAGILTISDTASTNPTHDLSGPLLADGLSSAGFGTIVRAVVADDVEAIRRVVARMFDDDGVDLVVTSGGTGFGVRDVTPEAIESMVTRKTPALSHALIAGSLRTTAMAALSRGVTGIRRGRGGREALVVTLPGSPRAVRECLEVLLADGLVFHALELLSGGSGEPRHIEMQAGLHRCVDVTHAVANPGCAHHHGGGAAAGAGGLHSHPTPKPRTTASDHIAYQTIHPTTAPSLRHRTSPYPLLTLDDALTLIATHTRTPTHIDTLPVNASLIGHILAQDITAPSDLPPGATTNVDGYAVNATTTPPGNYRVVTLSTLQTRPLSHGEILRINTGQPLPMSTNAVVMVEDTQLLESSASGQELSVRVLAHVEVGENVRASGSDVKAGHVVLSKGTTVTALGGEIGTLAFVGRSHVDVFRKPRIAVLSTGNELRDVCGGEGGERQSWGFHVYDANRPGLIGAICGLGYPIVDLGIVCDDPSTMLSALKHGLETADIVITTGGTSMGESDLVKPLLERDLDAQIHFGRVAMKPGKPTTFASVRGKLVFALPGNPASALVTFYVFVLPAMRKLSGVVGVAARGANAWSLATVAVVLGDEMRLDSRVEFHRVIVTAEAAGLVAYSTGAQRSSGMHSMSTANALIVLPPLSPTEQRKVLKKGELAKAMLLGNIV